MGANELVFSSHALKSMVSRHYGALDPECGVPSEIIYSRVAIG